MNYYKEVLSILNLNSSDSILDYGCGRGDFTNILLNLTNNIIIAADCRSEMIDHITQRFSYNKVKATIASSPNDITDYKFDKIICHNVLECIDDKIDFINQFKALLADDGNLIISHFDFDSAIYNSGYKELTRDLIHKFADHKQNWMANADGQVGRKMPSIMSKTKFKQYERQLIRLNELDFIKGNYGFLMVQMLRDVGKYYYDDNTLNNWFKNLTDKHHKLEYFLPLIYIS